MMVAVFFMGKWLGAHMDGSAAALVHGIAFWSVLIAASAWTLVQRYAPN
jgi:DHA1 family bicyclomycin/chloramphenicol resistance-like MFS transporter